DVAKEIAESFAKALTIEKNVDKGLALTGVPFAKIEQSGGLKAVMIRNSEELKKRILKELDLRGDEKQPMATLVKTYNAQNGKFFDQFGVEVRKGIDEVLVENDRFLTVDVPTGGFGMEVLVLVSWRDGKAKV